MSEYSVDEVLESARKAAASNGRAKEASMLFAYAERIEADEGVVPVAWQFKRRPEDYPDEWSQCSKEHYDACSRREGSPWIYRELFDHPPAQAAQAALSEALNALEDAAVNGHKLLGDDALRFRALVDRIAPTAEPVAPVKPRVIATMMHANSQVYGVDFKLEGGAEIEFRGMECMNDLVKVNMCSFSSEPAAHANDAITDYYTGRNRGGWAAPRNKTAREEAAEPVAQGEAVTALAVDRACLAYDNATTEVADYPSETGMRAALEDFLAAQPRAVPDVAAMVNRFLGWRLPDDFYPDGGISFTHVTNPSWTHDSWPIGTNLFTAAQAEQMFRYVLAVPASPAGVPDGWVSDPDTIPKPIIDACRDAICREFGNNGTDGYYKRILAKVFAALAAAPSPGESA